MDSDVNLLDPIHFRELATGTRVVMLGTGTPIPDAMVAMMQSDCRAHR